MDTPIVSFNTSLYRPSLASRFMVTSPVDGSTSDIYDLSLREMSSGYSEFYLRIYEDIKNKGNRSIVEEWGDFFKVDSQGRKSAQ